MGAIDRINKKVKRIQQEEEVKAGKKTSLEASMSNIEDFRNELKTNGKIDYADTSTIIAPYKTSTKKSSDEDKPWYKTIIKGSDAYKTVGSDFNDGYDFGDLTKTLFKGAGATAKTVGSTAADIGLNVVEGVARVGEGLGTLAAGGVAQVADWTGNDKYAQKVRDRISGKEKTAFGTTGAPVSYWLNKGQDKLDKNSVSGKSGDEIASLIGYTGGLVYGGQALGGLSGTASVGTASTGVSANLGNVALSIKGHALNVPTLAFVGGASSGLTEAYSKENVSDKQAWSKALGSGAIEGVTEGLFGMFGVGGSGLDDALSKAATKGLKSGLAKTLASTGIKASGEAFEELLSYMGNQGLDLLIDKASKEGNADFYNKWDWEEVGEQMGMAFISAGLSQGGSTVVNSNVQSNIAIKNAEQELGRSLTDQEKKEVKEQVLKAINDEAEVKTEDLTPVKNQINNTTTQEEQTNSLVEAPSNTLNNGNKLSEAFIEEIKNKTIEANKDKANVEYVSTEELLPYQKRGGYRTSEEVTKLEDNIKENGITSPIELIKKSNGEIEIANGTHRLDIANKLGLKQIPVTYVNSNMENIANSNEVLYNNKNQEDLDYYEGEYNGSIRNSEVAIKNNDRSRVEEGNRVTNNIASENEGTTRGNDRVLTEVQGHNDGSPSNTTYKQNTKQELDNSSFFNEKNKTKDNTGKNVSEEKQEALKDSKVRDENGNLIRMYHGSPNGTYEKLKGGTYFTEDYNYAERYKNPGASSISYGKSENNPKVYEAYLDIKKPFDINDSEARDIYINEYVKGGNAMGINPYLTDAEYNKIDNIDWTEVEDLKTFLEENGYDYDGIVSYEGADGGYGQEVVDRGKSYIPFNEGQIINAEENAQNIEDTVQNSIPTKEELDNLENVRQNQSGSEYASAFYDLENKYGKANLYKGINEYNSNAKNNVVSNETTQNIQEDIAPIKEAAEDLKQAQKEVVAQVKELQKEIKSIKTTIEDVKALTEEDLPAIETQASENFKNIREEDIPPIMENTTPEVEEEISPTKSLTDIRDYEEVGSKKVNAYQYDNPEVKPYFQDAAIGMLNDLEMSTKGERYIIGDISQTGNGDYQYSGTKRNTTSDIAELLDGMDGKYQYSYDEIEKGLKAIIEDHGAENIAVAKRIEFFLDERLRNGYTTLDGYDIPANQEYLNTLREKEYADYYSSLPINENAPMEVEEEIAPVKENVTTEEDDLNELLSHYKERYKNADLRQKDELGRKIKGLSMELAAIKRAKTQGDSLIPIEGGLTKIELDNKIKKLKSNYVGKEVIADNKQGKIFGNSFGKIGVEFEDGTKKYYEKDLIKPVNDIDSLIKQQKLKSKIAPVKEKYEAITPKEQNIKPTPEVKQNDYIPMKKASNNSDSLQLKQRKWVETSTESEVVNNEILPKDLDATKIYYEPISNKKTLNKANSMLDTYGYEKAVEHFNNKILDKNTTLEDIALGERLVQEAINMGDTTTAGELIQNIAILGTDLGQKVQALSIIQRMTPEGQLKMLQKTVNRAKIKGDKAFQNVEITQDMIDEILSVYNKYKNANQQNNENTTDTVNNTNENNNNVSRSAFGSYDQQDLNNAIENVKQKIANQMETSTMEKINAWRYLSMLGNPKTHIRNIVSNVAMKGTVAVKNAMARTIEDIAPIKNKTKTWEKASQEVIDYTNKTTEEMKDIISGDSGYSDEVGLRKMRRTFKNDILEKTYNFNSDMLEKEDWWFSKAAFKNSFSEYLTANGIKTTEDIAYNPEIIEKARNYAVEQAQIATFRQYSWLSNKIREIENKNKASQIAVGSILPFKKTPINIAKTALNYSPLGFTKTLTYDINEVKKGNMEASTLIDHIAQNTTGTALTLIGYMLAKSGLLSGAGGDDEESKYDSQLGKQAYSVNIGGKSYSLSWLSPVAMPLFVGANAYEQLEEGKEWNGDVVIETLSKTLDPLNEMSFLSGLTSTLSSYDKGTQKIAGMAESVIQNYASQFVPTASSQVAATMDDTKRSTKVSGDSGFKFFDETINKLKYKIPGLRNTLEPSTDIWGNDIKQSENIIERAFENFLAPYAKKENTATEIDENIKEVFKQTGDNGVIPNVPKNYINFENEKYKMSAKEYTEYKKTYGQTANELLEDLFDNFSYKNANSTEKANMINDVYKYAGDVAKKDYLDSKNVDYTNATENKEKVYKEKNIKGAIENDMTVDEYKLYEKDPDKYNFLKENGISFDEYDDNREEYNYAFENPSKYALSQAIAKDYKTYKTYTSEINDIKADKDSNGKSIKDSRKYKIINYVNNLELDIPQKAMLIRSEYSSFDDYNDDIVEYIVNLDMDYEKKKSALEALKMTVYEDGTVGW